MTSPSIGTQIERTRLRRGMTQEDVAATLGVAQSTVTRWERGARMGTDLELIQKVADFLERPYDEVLEEWSTERRRPRQGISDAETIDELRDEVATLRSQLDKQRDGIEGLREEVRRLLEERSDGRRPADG